MNSNSSSSITQITMWWPSVVIVLLLQISNLVVSQSIINTLPGFTGELPFKLETGYIGVGELDEVQLFYYFIESERSPKDDPLVLWLTGGPGCSGFSTLFYEMGPLSFNYANSSGNKPTLELNPYSWTKVANIIFLDSPVGTGFSYATTWEAYNVNDTLLAAQIYEFLRKWLLAHSMFLSNPLYIGGESYSGIPVPIIAQEVLNGNEIGNLPPLILKGFVLGNPLTHRIYDVAARLKFAHRMALISDRLYENNQYLYSYIWANDKTVREALHIREGTITNWERCNTSLAYTMNVITSIDYHRNLTKKDIRALVYSGDHDMAFPYVSTEEWIETLDLSIKDDWRPWFVGGQIAGYVTIFAEEKYSLTFTTIKGGGHTTPEYKPKECLAMIDRWFSYYFL
ncbi:serine carboxypeptidase-like 18 [Juglans microcarpa x Juglans regia]|uniref:serine carboxypeptidase-like 18 n=1 Tax=Juglans microcarpa x Juglans regia TaxID=2249226 RepID=UPI001B7DDFD5|nr:serine carboxypeptidase-like 18 [Juglans microcarpa x Juglans regia]